MLVLAPAACCLAGVAVHEALVSLFRGIHSSGKDSAAPQQETPTPMKPRKAAKGATKVCAFTFFSVFSDDRRLVQSCDRERGQIAQVGLLQRVLLRRRCTT